MARPLLSALALLLAFAAPAHADGTLFARGADPPAAPPRLAGDRVVWATHSEAGFGLHVAGHDGSQAASHTIGTPDHGYYSLLQLAASPARMAVSLYERDCAGYCNLEPSETLFRGTLSAPLGEPPARLDPECQSIDETPRVDVWEDVVAYRDACSHRTVVRDLAAPPGEPRAFEYPEALAIQVAGPYLLTREGDALILREWRTGAERFRLDRIPTNWALQADGKVGLVRSSKADTYVLWRSADDPREHLVAADVEPGILMADDMLVLSPRGGGIAVRRLDGSLVAESRTARQHDFDGRRLAWSHRPCALLGILTWDLEGEAPEMPPGRCPLAGNRRTELTADFSRFSPPERRYGTTPALIECPPGPRLGCIGRVRLVAPDARPGRKGTVEMAKGFYAMAPGETREVELAFGKRRICIARRGALRPTLEIHAAARDGVGEERLKRRRVRLRGIKERLCT